MISFVAKRIIAIAFQEVTISFKNQLVVNFNNDCHFLQLS